MAGETYGSVGAAFSGGLENYLLKQQALEHQKLLDDMAQKREARLMQNDALDADLRRQELAARTQEMTERQNDRKLQTHLKKREALIPGDVPSPELVQEAKALGVPLRLGEAPTKPNPAPPALQAVDEPPMADVPMSPDANRPYEGTREDIARKKLADVMTGDPDPNIVTAEALRLGIDPREITSVLTANKGPKSKVTPEIGLVAKGPDGKVIPGLVAMGEDGGVLLNGQPLPQGATVERAPAPRDPLLEDLTRSQIERNRRVGSGGGGKGLTAGYTPEGLEYAATRARLTGQYPGRNAEVNAAIENEVAKQNAVLKQSPAAAIQRQASYKADAASLQDLTKRASSAEAFEIKALGQIPIIEELSKQVPRTQWPIINQAIQAGNTKLLGDSKATQFANAVETFTEEYTKIMQGSTGSAVAATDSARAAAKRLINTAMNEGTMRDVLALMRREMSLTLQGYDVTKQHISERMVTGATPGEGTGMAPSAAPPKSKYKVTIE